jgi:hypothetical protein
MRKTTESKRQMKERVKKQMVAAASLTFAARA